MNDFYEETYGGFDGDNDEFGDFDLFLSIRPVVIWGDFPCNGPVLMPAQLWNIKNIIKKPPH